MEQEASNKKTTYNSEISLAEIAGGASKIIKYILSRWLLVCICGVIGGAAGLAFAIFQKPTYTATCTFVLEESGKGGALGQYAGLAALAGVNLDNAESGLFQGDNIFALYKSRLMIEKTLLREADFDGKKERLIDRYIEFNKLRHRWKSKDNIDTINFENTTQSFSRKQDSIITDIAKTFNKLYLSVEKPDKKLNIIQVDFKSKDELFAKNFTELLVENVNLFYVQTKTKKSYQNLVVLQHQADSVRAELDKQIGGVASAIDASPNANPLLQTLRVPSQKKQVDVQANTAIYAEIVKNLEVSKITLRKETPLIQLIDVPVLPLENNRFGKVIGFLSGFVAFSLALCLFLGIRKLLSNS